MALLEMANLTLQPAGGKGPVQQILSQMPDPMRPDPVALVFAIVLLVVLYIYLKRVLFNPLTRVMEDRDRDMRAGDDAKAKAAAELDARQKDYQARLKELRAQAFNRRKALADAAGQEKLHMLDAARAKSTALRQEALEALKAQQASARQELLSQVDALAESMARTLLKQA